MGLAQEKFLEEFCAAWGDGSSELDRTWKQFCP
jgi:hypothetical protein